VLIDLHAHSSVSDGTDSPTALLEAAARADVDVLALADHDTTQGLAEARRAGSRVGVDLVPAIELSTTWRDADVHLLVYWPDEDDEALQSMLATIRDGRRRRIPRMLARLAAHGIDVSEQDVRRVAGGAASLGRPHVADALVAAGIVGSRGEAFDTWIGEGMAGHVSKPAPTLRDAIATARRAHGVPVLAHPWGRGSRSVLDVAALADLADAGLVGLEVEHVDHDAQDRALLRTIASQLDLVATGGSDYHGTGKEGVALGMNGTAEDAYVRLVAQRGAA